MNFTESYYETFEDNCISDSETVHCIKIAFLVLSCAIGTIGKCFFISLVTHCLAITSRNEFPSAILIHAVTLMYLCTKGTFAHSGKEIKDLLVLYIERFA